jgi:hypothetical protein
MLKRSRFSDEPLLCNAKNGIEIDIALAVCGFEEQEVERSSRSKYMLGCTLVTASAEDLVVLKAISDRDCANSKRMPVRWNGWNLFDLKLNNLNN